MWTVTPVLSEIPDDHVIIMGYGRFFHRALRPGETEEDVRQWIHTLPDSGATDVKTFLVYLNANDPPLSHPIPENPMHPHRYTFKLDDAKLIWNDREFPLKDGPLEFEPPPTDDATRPTPTVLPSMTVRFRLPFQFTDTAARIRRWFRQYRN